MIGFFVVLTSLLYLARITSNEGEGRTAALGRIPISSPKLLPDLAFKDAEGTTVRLQDFRGKLVLLNVWATWCVPCRKEMPALDRLEATLGGPRFQVVALSVDRSGRQAVEKFFSTVGLKTLHPYLDESGASMRALDIIGLPTTLLLDGDGREIARIVGSREWDSREVITELQHHLDGGHPENAS